MTTRFLADTSAIVRMLGDKTEARWAELSREGMIAICDPVEIEFLRGIGAGRLRRRAKERLSTTFTWCVVPERGWIEAYRLQDQLARRSQHGGASVVDLVVAVTAGRHGLTVLHDDRDYEAISRVTGLPVQRVTD